MVNDDRFSPLKNSLSFRYVITILAGLLFVFLSLLIGCSISNLTPEDFKFSDLMAVNAFSMTLAVVLVTMLTSNIQDYAELKQREIEHDREHDRRLKEREIDRIGDSINLFYLPLYSLLTTFDEKVTLQSRNIEVADINGHKYLAEPRVRSVFEKYLQNSNESQKLLELVNRDIELLQHRFIELDQKLKDH